MKYIYCCIRLLYFDVIMHWFAANEHLSPVLFRQQISFEQNHIGSEFALFKYYGKSLSQQRESICLWGVQCYPNLQHPTSTHTNYKTTVARECPVKKKI